MKGYVALKRSSGKRGACLYTNPLDTLNDYPLIDYRGDLIEAAKVETLTEPSTDDKKGFTQMSLQ